MVIYNFRLLMRRCLCLYSIVRHIIKRRQMMTCFSFSFAIAARQTCTGATCSSCSTSATGAMIDI